MPTFDYTPINSDIGSGQSSFFGIPAIRDTVRYFSVDSPYDLHVDLMNGETQIKDTTDVLHSGPRAIRIYETVATHSLSSIENVIGGGGGDRIIGTNGSNLLVGMSAGPDFTGSGGFKPGLSGATHALQGLGNTNNSHNRLDGNGGNDILMGDLGIGDGAMDLLHGDDGDDILDGGIGVHDELWGGAGEDWFVFTNSSGIYHIMDWSTSDDDGIMRPI
ncbi:hypothetical protein [Profundibacter sp.]